MDIDIIELLLNNDNVERLLSYINDDILQKYDYFCITNCMEDITAGTARKKLGSDKLKTSLCIETNLKIIEELEVSRENYIYFLYFLFNSKYQSNDNKTIKKEEYDSILYALLSKYVCEISQTYNFKNGIIFKTSYSIDKINSLSDFIKRFNVVDDIQFFRGHGNINYREIPGFFRDLYDVDEDVMIQDIMITHSNEFASCKNKIQQLSLLQHYGFPTRLLDVTTNPLVALYFACENKQRIGEVIEYKVPKQEILFENDDEVKKLCDLDKSAKEYLFVQPVYNSRRMVNQRGAFIAFKNVTAINERVKSIYYIEPKEKEKILKELMMYGIDESFIYPELDHKCSSVKEKYKSLQD